MQTRKRGLMKRNQLITALLVVSGALLFATPRLEAGHFSFSFFFPLPPVQCAPPPQACPPPAPPPCNTWVPSHYEVQTENVWVPGACETIWVPPSYRTIWDGCRWIRVTSEPGHYATIQHPGHYEYQEVRVWVPGHYEMAQRIDEPPREHASGNSYSRGNDPGNSNY